MPSLENLGKKMSENECCPKISIVITDRLKETKRIETKLIVTDETKHDKKQFNKELLERLKQFQHEANEAMTEFVGKENEALKAKKLSNDHLKKPVNNETDNGSSDEDLANQSSKTQKSSHLKRSKENKSNICEPLEKKPCIENSQS